MTLYVQKKDMSENKIRVLKLVKKIKQYNVPVNNLLSEKYDYTVLFCQECEDDGRAEWKFKTIYEPLPPKGLKWLWFLWKVAKICRQYDVVIGLTDYYPISYLPRKNKFIFWSIGVPASYTIHFGEGSDDDYRKRTKIEKHADANIFYTEEAKKLRMEHGYDGPKIFVAHNTTKVLKRELSKEDKDSVLFIGSLHAAKGIQVLLDAYKAAYNDNKDLVKLNIVGGGTPLPQIRRWVTDNELTDVINVLGPIYDEERKADLFMKSLACISPLQAGLSVLESMGYGVPFITDANAITGGEAYNIKNGETGYRLKGLNVEKLKETVLDITIDKDKYINMGKNAYDYYWSCCKPEDMVKGVIDAIEYVINKQ